MKQSLLALVSLLPLLTRHVHAELPLCDPGSEEDPPEDPPKGGCLMPEDDGLADVHRPSGLITQSPIEEALGQMAFSAAYMSATRNQFTPRPRAEEQFDIIECQKLIGKNEVGGWQELDYYAQRDLSLAGYPPLDMNRVTLSGGNTKIDYIKLEGNNITKTMVVATSLCPSSGDMPCWMQEVMTTQFRIRADADKAKPNEKVGVAITRMGEPLDCFKRSEIWNRESGPLEFDFQTGDSVQWTNRCMIKYSCNQPKVYQSQTCYTRDGYRWEPGCDENLPP